MSGYREGCAAPACIAQSLLDTAYLRVQLSPPGQPWTMLRFCDLCCLLEWLEHEACADHAQVFCREEWIDSSA